jgi:glycyl-tRNA synthetase beta chain
MKDVVADRPLDVLARAKAVADLDHKVRSKVVEVFKRAKNLSVDADEKEVINPSSFNTSPNEREVEEMVYTALVRLKRVVLDCQVRVEYTWALSEISELAPILETFFKEVFVMSEDLPLRANRLRILRDIHRTCLKVADFSLLQC